jgi:hypothetical protein
MTAKQSLKLGEMYPYNGILPRDWFTKAANGVITELADRFDLDDVDMDTRCDILRINTLTDIK